MKSIILAAGYATRLYPLTFNQPKSLLKVRETTILDKLLADIDSIDLIDEHIIVINHKYFDSFKNWHEKSNYTKPVTIIDDGSTENENRLGAVNDLMLAINIKKIDDDLLVLAADNLLDFSLSEFVENFILIQTSMIMCHHESRIEALQKTGVIEIDENNKVIQMQEKPQLPISNWAVPPFYIYSASDVIKIVECINEGCATDAPGNLVNYMLHKTIFHAWKMTGKRFDIGSIETYNSIK